MNETSISIDAAAEILIQQDVCQRHLMQQLAQQSTQISHLQQQISINSSQSKLQLDNERLCEELLHEKQALQQENEALLRKVKTLEEENERSERERLHMSTMLPHQEQCIRELESQVEIHQMELVALGRDVEQSSLDLSSGGRISKLKSHWEAIQKSGLDRLEQQAYKQLKNITEGLYKWEQLRLSDNLFEGVCSMVGIFADMMTRMMDDCGALHPDLEKEASVWYRRFEGARSRTVHEVRQRQATYRTLKKTLKEKEEVVRRLETERLQQLQWRDVSDLSQSSFEFTNPEMQARYHTTRLMGRVQDLQQKLDSQAKLEKEQEERIAGLSKDLQAKVDRVLVLEQQISAKTHELQNAQLIETMQSKMQGVKDELAFRQATAQVETLELKLKQYEDDWIPKSEHLSICRQMEVNFVKETREILAASDAHLNRSVIEAEDRTKDEFHLLQNKVTAYEDRLATLETSLSSETEAHRECRYQLGDEQKRSTSLSEELGATKKELRNVQMTLHDVEKRLKTDMEFQSTKLTTMDTELTQSEARSKQWKEACQVLLMSTGEVRGLVRIATASILTANKDDASTISLPPTSNMSAGTGGLQGVPNITSQDLSAESLVQVHAFCRDVHCSLEGYIRSTGSVLESLKRGLDTSKQQQAKSKAKQQDALRTLLLKLSAVSKEHAKDRGAVHTSLSEMQRSMTVAVQSAVIQCREDATLEVDHYRQQVEAKESELEAVAAQLHSRQEEIAILTSQAQETSNQIRVSEMDKSAISDSLQELTVENEKLRKDLRQRSQEIEEIRAKLVTRDGVYERDLEEVRRQMKAILSQLSEAEKQNAALHSKLLSSSGQSNKNDALVHTKHNRMNLTSTEVDAFVYEASLQSL